MSKKKKTINYFSDGFVLRKHNIRIKVTKQGDGEAYKIHAMNCQENKDNNPTCGYKRVKSVDCTEFVISRESMLDIAFGIMEWEKSLKQFEEDKK